MSERRNKQKIDPAHFADMINLRQEVEKFREMTGKSETWVSRLCGSATFWTRLIKEKRAVRQPTAALIRKRMADWLAERRAETEVIRRWKGHIEVERNGEPGDLPPGITPRQFRMLVQIGYLAPADDAMFGGPAQTVKPIEFSDGAATV